MENKYTILFSQKSPKIKLIKNNKSINFGLSILKLILSFLVVTTHNFIKKTTNNKCILYLTKPRFLHVPSFFIISFYFTHKNFLSLDYKILLKRLIRLFIPYIIWPIFFWELNEYINRKYNKVYSNSFEDLKQQLLLANRFIFPLWFNLVLIIMTICFFIIIFIFRKHSLFILQIILILSYIIQYSGYNFNNFFVKNPYYNVRSYKSIHTSIPFAVTGYTLGYYNVLDIIQKNKIKVCVFSYLIYNMIADYNIFTNIHSENYYAGINLNIQSICIIFIFSLFPSFLITNNIIRKFLIIITNYTGGIYYLHVPLKKYLKKYSTDIYNGTFLGLIKTYIIIYFICYIGMLIFGKTLLKYLFC